MEITINKTKTVHTKHTLLIATDTSDKTFVSVTPNTTLDEAFQLLHTLSLHLLNAYTEVALTSPPLKLKPKDSQTDEDRDKINAVRQMMYDKYNVAVSSVLSLYAPEFELRPDITEKAIIEMENKILEEHQDEVSEV